MSVKESIKVAEKRTHSRTLLVDHDRDSLRYADISDLVKISKESFVRHFFGKSEFVRCVVDRSREESVKGVSTLDPRIVGPLRDFDAYVPHLSKCIRDVTPDFYNLAIELPKPAPEIAPDIRENSSAVSRLAHLGPNK